MESRLAVRLLPASLLIVCVAAWARHETVQTTGLPKSLPVAELSQSEQRRPVFRAGANFVTVDVYPRLDGSIVPGLEIVDFEVREDGKLQTIESVELIRFEGSASDADRRDPNTVRESWHLVADPRQRVFVLYLDTYHATLVASHNARPLLTDFLARVIGPNDLIALLTPETPTTAITFGRSIGGIEAFLTKHWSWGGTEYVRTPAEQQIEACALTAAPDPRSAKEYAATFVARWRLDRVMTHLDQLVARLGLARDERKHLLLVTEDWPLFGADDRLAPQPATPALPVGVTPGRSLPASRPLSPAAYAFDCRSELTRLATIDAGDQFEWLINNAHRANVSFYPVNPIGLHTTDIMANKRAQAPQKRSNQRPVVERLGHETDGIPILDTNEVAGHLKRLADQLSSYYLVGYYSTNTTFDGKYRKIDVRVRRPRVEVTARRGYLAPTLEMLAASTTSPPMPDANTSARKLVDGPTLYRKGPGADWTLTTELQFHRVERLQLEWTLVTGAADRAEARLLGRTGQPLPVSVPVTARPDAGRSVLVAELGLAPLAAGDYAIELNVTQASDSARVVTRFRIVR